MVALLNPRFLIGLALAGALAFTHFFVYRAGKAHVRLEYAAAQAKANNEARALEQRRQDRADEAGRLAASREVRIRADAASARAAADSLRDTLDAVERASQNSGDAARESVAALSSVFADCSRRYQELAEIADRHASDSLKLQQSWPAPQK